MNEWMRYFFGTPQRFLRTTIAICLVVVALNPAILSTAVESLLSAFMPLLGPALAICIVFAGFRMMFNGRK